MLLKATIVIVAISLLAFPRVHALEQSNMTVVTVTGWEYRDVTIEIALDSLSVDIVNPDGARKSISRANIRAILDEAGNDITDSVLASRAEAVGNLPSSSSTDSKAPRPTSSAPVAGIDIKPYHSTPSRNWVTGSRWRFMLSAGPGFSAASGEWFEGMTSGAAFHGTARILLTEGFYIGLAYRHQKMGVSSDWEGSAIVTDPYGNPIYVEADWDITFEEYYFVLGYSTYPSRMRSPIGYVDIGFGSIEHNITLKVTSGYDYAAATTEMSKFGMLIAAGGVFPVADAVGFSLEGNFRLTGSGSTDDPYVQSSSGLLMGVATGVTILLGN